MVALDTRVYLVHGKDANNALRNPDNNNRLEYSLTKWHKKPHFMHPTSIYER